MESVITINKGTGDFMALAEREKAATNSTESIDSAMNILFGKLDEAIDDMENGNVLSEDEFWSEIDAI